ncbi:hypothetical protein MUN78_16440 [Leucobacter allii]|uniref:Uncharacterized protein n=1 Tax=Leucobacter allii TaxID=2932247 RepID=A0ABY4FLS1_9MICO|nr:hypothetical protein [Leucobacter allii]UOQ57219.1 hypothetical protein MUN78_16440 [Leucobacter allii]
MTDDEKRELIAAALMNSDSLNHERLCGCNAWPCVTYGTTRPWSHDAEFVAMEVLRLADALEGTLDESEWEYCIVNGLGVGIYMAYSLEEALQGIARDQSSLGSKPKRSLMRRRKAGPWEPLPVGGETE